MNIPIVILLVAGCATSFCLGIVSGRAACTARLRSLLLGLRDAASEDDLSDAEHEILRYVHDEMPRGGP